jgi:hypothetical protein
MSLGYDPIASLESIGYVEREATFLYLVAVHSGYFLRRQYLRFAGRDGGTLIGQLLRKATQRRHLRVIECTHGRHIYHLTSKPVYAALGRPDSQNRRIKSDGHIKSRLMVLDFLLSHLRAQVLEDEAAKVEFFTTQSGIAHGILPGSFAGLPHYFSDGFPILVTPSGTPQFTFFDEGQITATRFERFLRQYQALFDTLRDFELIYVSNVASSSGRARSIFERFLPPDRLRGITTMTPLGVDHFLEYLAAGRRYNTKGGITSARDLELLCEGDPLYASLEHHALQSAWDNGSTNSDKIRQRFLQKSLRVTFTTVVLPYRYPTDPVDKERRIEHGCQTILQTMGETMTSEGKS